MQSSILELGSSWAGDSPEGQTVEVYLHSILCLFTELLQAIGKHRLSQEQLTLGFYFC